MGSKLKRLIQFKFFSIKFTQYKSTCYKVLKFNSSISNNFIIFVETKFILFLSKIEVIRYFHL
jgi:hypothetical protein